MNFAGLKQFFVFPRQMQKIFTRSKSLNSPTDSNEMPRSGGIASLFRLPIQESQPGGLDACFVGIPMDNGCSNRSGTRLGPRAIRNESVLIRYSNKTGALPFESLQVADIGDVPIVPYNMQRTIDIITEYFLKIMDANCIPLAMGGDHTMTYPILRAIKKKHGAVGLIQIDAHADLGDSMMGEKVAHGTPFMRAIEEELVDPRCMFQIGLRGSEDPDDAQDYQYAQEKVCSYYNTIRSIANSASSLHKRRGLKKESNWNYKWNLRMKDDLQLLCPL